MISVMAMNSQGNESLHVPLDTASASRRFDEQRLIPNFDATINPTDVLCGRGKSSFTHVGNRRFRDAITNAIDEYNSSESRLTKSRVVQRIVEKIKGGGGRFLKRDRATGGWVELDTKSCRDKVGHAIRDAASLLESRKHNYQRRKDAFARLEDTGRSATGFREESKLSISTRLREGNTFLGGGGKLSSQDDDEDLFYETASQGKAKEDYFLWENDSFVRFINEVLGPISSREIRFDPLVEYNTDDEFYSPTWGR